MSEQPAELQRMCGTNGCSVFQVFRTFKIALHHNKLLLALAAIVLTGIWGGALDLFWPAGQQPVKDEVNAFWQTQDVRQWRETTLASRESRVREAFSMISGTGSQPSAREKEILRELKDHPKDAVKHTLKELEDRYEAAVRGKDEQASVAIARQYIAAHDLVSRARNTGIFCSFLSYETACLRQFIDSAACLRITGGLHDVLNARSALLSPWTAANDPAAASMASAVANFNRAAGTPLRLNAMEEQYLHPIVAPAQTHAGMLASLVLMARGFQWLLVEHPFFAILFGLGKLAIWALFGGAICRMAAMNYARDERIPVKTALAFAWRKFLGFATAPLMPVGATLLIGAVLWVAGAVGKIPGVGEILAGLGMILALLGGLVMALILVGFMGGVSLMWPTVAAEGSDSFDALSRSYSYVYQRPWKAALYALAASVYGAICYLFARFFVFVALRSTRAFVAAGMNWKTSRPGTGIVGAGKLDAMWPVPSFDSLWHDPSPFSYMHAEWLGMVMIKIWVMLLVCSLCAFLASFYFSSSTIIYFLLRREVDSTDLEEVDPDGELEDEIITATIGGAGPTATA